MHTHRKAPGVAATTHLQLEKTRCFVRGYLAWAKSASEPRASQRRPCPRVEGVIRYFRVLCFASTLLWYLISQPFIGAGFELVYGGGDIRVCCILDRCAFISRWLIQWHRSVRFLSIVLRGCPMHLNIVDYFVFYWRQCMTAGLTMLLMVDVAWTEQLQSIFSSLLKMSVLRAFCGFQIA